MVKSRRVESGSIDIKLRGLSEEICLNFSEWREGTLEFVCVCRVHCKYTRRMVVVGVKIISKNGLISNSCLFDCMVKQELFCYPSNYLYNMFFRVS